MSPQRRDALSAAHNGATREDIEGLLEAVRLFLQHTRASRFNVSITIKGLPAGGSETEETDT